MAGKKPSTSTPKDMRLKANKQTPSKQQMPMSNQQMPANGPMMQDVEKMMKTKSK